MALRTVGTNANNSLGGFLIGTDDLTAATVALLTIKTPLAFVNGALVGNVRNLVNGGYTQQGTLTIPGRGILVCQPGDFIGLDPNTGWPILLSADTAANGTWTHT